MSGKLIVNGALEDEFQQYVYAAGDGLTLEMLNEKYYELCAEYGVLGDNGELRYDWVDTSHTFTRPCYFISYATSAAGALAVWEESQNDFYGAVDKYLAFAALAQMLYDQAGESAGTAATFADVSPDASYAAAVAWAGERGFILGYGTFGPDDPVTREQAAVILCRHAGAAGTDGDLSAFADGTIVSDWAAEAMAWAVDAGLLAGDDGARLNPRGQTTRVGAADMLLRTAWMET